MNRWIFRVVVAAAVLTGIYIAAAIISFQVVDCISVCEANGCTI